jgi:hypothetical protein
MPKFKPGSSGNPAGRPKGSGYAHLRAQIAAAAPEIVNTLIEAAKAGDSRAARLLLERVVPPLKAESDTLELDNVPSYLSDQLGVVITAMLAGQVPPSQAREAITALCMAARATPNELSAGPAFWIVPPELSLEEWTKEAQKLVQKRDSVGHRDMT